jgi:hypothetical protein
MTMLRFEGRSVLTKLLETCEAADGYVYALRFRADHSDELNLLDQLVRDRYIVQEHNMYRLGAMGLVQLPTPAATSIMQQAEGLWLGLRNHYKAHLSQQILLPDLAQSCGLGLSVTLRTLMYMLDVPWHGGYSGGHGQPIESIAATEEVLKYQSFAQLVGEVHSWDVALGVGSHLDEAASVALPTSPTLPDWLPRLPLRAQTLMREIHVASAEGLHSLAAMGIRAVVDVVCLDHVGADTGSFAAKLKALRDAGHLTDIQRDALLAVVDAGSAAAHRGYAPDTTSLRAMLGALNHMLQSLYGKRSIDHALARG